MKIVNIEILGKTHKIACAQGQETDLEKLANLLNERINKIATSHPNAPESLVLVMAALQMQDELKLSPRTALSNATSESEIANLLENVAEKINKIGINV